MPAWCVDALPVSEPGPSVARGSEWPWTVARIVRRRRRRRGCDPGSPPAVPPSPSPVCAAAVRPRRCPRSPRPCSPPRAARARRRPSGCRCRCRGRAGDVRERDGVGDQGNGRAERGAGGAVAAAGELGDPEGLSCRRRCRRRRARPRRRPSRPGRRRSRRRRPVGLRLRRCPRCSSVLFCRCPQPRRGFETIRRPCLHIFLSRPRLSRINSSPSAQPSWPSVGRIFPALSALSAVLRLRTYR